MKRVLAKISCLFLLPLAGCSSSTIRVPDGEFGVSLFLNGEILGKRYRNGDGYSSFCIEDDGTKVVEALNANESVFIIQAAKDCSHCSKLEPIMCDFLSLYPIKAYLFESETLNDVSSVKNAIATVKAAYPSFDFTLAFPMGNVIGPEKALDSFTFSGHMASVGELSSFLLEKFHNTNIVEYQNFKGFEDSLKENGLPGYIYSSSKGDFIANEQKDIEGNKRSVALVKNPNLEEGYYRYENGLIPIQKEEAINLLKE